MCQLILTCFIRDRLILQTYLGCGWPGLLALEADPGIDVGNRQEFGDLGVCHHFRRGTCQDSHGYGVSK